MQTTTAVSADVPTQTQHITKGRSLWIEEAMRLHDADDHYRFRRHASKNASGKRRGSTRQTTTAVSADVPAGRLALLTRNSKHFSVRMKSQDEIAEWCCE